MKTVKKSGNRIYSIIFAVCNFKAYFLWTFNVTKEACFIPDLFG